MKKFNNKPLQTEQTTISQSKEDNVHRRLIIDDTIKKRAAQQQVAINAHFEKFILFRKGHHHYDRCPCHQDEDPIASCPLCYGEGELPAYQIEGTRHHVLFHGGSMVAALNFKLDYKDSSGIPSFKMIEGAYNANLISDWIDIQPFMADSDIEIWHDIEPELASLVSLFYKVDSDKEWQTLDSLEEAFKVNSRVKFKLQISKNEPDDRTPAIKGVHLRYKTQAFRTLEATTPQWNQTIDRTTLGLLKLIEQGTLNVQCDVENIENGDFFEHEGTNQRFRVTAIDSMESLGTTFDWQLRVRRVQDDELLMQIK